MAPKRKPATVSTPQTKRTTTAMEDCSGIKTKRVRTQTDRRDADEKVRQSLKRDFSEVTEVQLREVMVDDLCLYDRMLNMVLENPKFRFSAERVKDLKNMYCTTGKWVHTLPPGKTDQDANDRLLGILKLFKSKSTKDVSQGRARLQSYLATCTEPTHVDLCVLGRELVNLKASLNKNAVLLIAWGKCLAKYELQKKFPPLLEDFKAQWDEALCTSCDEAASSNIALPTWWQSIRCVIDLFAPAAAFENLWAVKPHYASCKKELKELAGPDSIQIGKKMFAVVYGEMVMSDVGAYIRATIFDVIKADKGLIPTSLDKVLQTCEAKMKSLGFERYPIGMQYAKMSYCNFTFRVEVKDVWDHVNAQFFLLIGEACAGGSMPFFNFEYSTFQFSNRENFDVALTLLEGAKLARTSFNECIPRESWSSGSNFKPLVEAKTTALKSMDPHVGVHLTWMKALCSEEGQLYFDEVVRGQFPDAPGEKELSDVLETMKVVQNSDLLALVAGGASQRLHNVQTCLKNLERGDVPPAALKGSSDLLTALWPKFDNLIPIPQDKSTADEDGVLVQPPLLAKIWLTLAQDLKTQGKLTSNYLNVFSGFSSLLTEPDRKILAFLHKDSWKAAAAQVQGVPAVPEAASEELAPLTGTATPQAPLGSAVDGWFK